MTAPSDASAPLETELKLICPADGLDRLRGHPLLAGAPTRVARLVSTYFDTTEGTLARAGYALRVRKDGGERWQALKNQGEAQGGLHVRNEWEMPLAGETPDLSLLPAPHPRATVEALVGNRSLVGLIVTDFERATWLVDHDGAVIEVALDVGSVSALDRRTPLIELELELKAGPRAAVFALALALAEGAPLRLTGITKAERGVALLEARAPRPVAPPPAPAVALAAGTPVEEALAVLSHAALADLLSQAPRVEGDTPVDGVHQTRVALRRLRAVVSLFEDAVAGPDTLAVREDLRWLMGTLGPLRDADVLTETLLPTLAPFLAGEAGWPALLAAAHARRQALRAEARAALEAPRFTTLALRAFAWIGQGHWRRDPARAAWRALPLGPIADDALARRWRRARRAGREFDTLSVAQRHALRVTLKRLRYTLENLGPLYPGKATRDTVRALKAVQDALGDANDIAVARQALSRLAEASGDPALAFVAGRASGLIEARLPDVETRARAAWQAFAALTPAWEA
ncbi:CYTH and CHAD domain-containing protein [Pararhodospirillum oryzae]|uniref:Inorganic triphosphatase n=1 Tax=Pararhodospirillum oryzae TaxID=478448 RepID=A0A512HA86_9PROT|nr:CYTH and CHAD domain-containing protein [Pararhodospirillum oryzae]GEO82373.1 inorganic triphosphatase [Pararhodospirillum oryzae]